MSKHDINKAYVSPYDRFLYKYDATHDKTASQLKEMIKHQRIAILRDDPDAVEVEEEIWTGF